MHQGANGRRGGQSRHDELRAIAAELRRTAPYAIDPAFKERLRKTLLQQLAEQASADEQA